MEIINMGGQISYADFEQFSVGVYKIDVFSLFRGAILQKHYPFNIAENDNLMPNEMNCCKKLKDSQRKF